MIKRWIPDLRQLVRIQDGRREFIGTGIHENLLYVLIFMWYSHKYRHKRIVIHGLVKEPTPVGKPGGNADPHVSHAKTTIAAIEFRKRISFSVGHGRIKTVIEPVNLGGFRKHGLHALVKKDLCFPISQVMIGTKQPRVKIPFRSASASQTRRTKRPSAIRPTEPNT